MVDTVWGLATAFSSIPSSNVSLRSSLSEVRRKRVGSCPRLGHSESLLLHHSHWPNKIPPWECSVEPCPLYSYPSKLSFWPLPTKES